MYTIMTNTRIIYRGLAYAAEGIFEAIGYKLKRISKRIMDAQMRRAQEQIKLMGYNIKGDN